MPKRRGYFRDDDSVQLHQVPVTNATSNLGFWLQYCRAVAKWGATKGDVGADIVHCHDWMTALAGLNLSRRFRIRLVFSVHLPQAGGANLYLENLGLRYADVVMVNSEAVKHELLSRIVRPRQVEVIPNGVDTAFYVPRSKRRRQDGCLLFVGRLVPQKGVDVLLRAFAVVKHRLPNVRLVVAGEGELELYLQRMTRHLGISRDTAFVGWKSGPSLLELYQGATVVVIPSYYEPFGIVALEAMACGVPVLASATGGLGEIIQDGVQGHLVRVGDHLDLARSIVNLLLDQKKLSRMRKAARKHSLDYAWKALSGKTLNVYSRIASCDIVSASYPVRPRLPKNLDKETKEAVGEILLQIPALPHDQRIGKRRKTSI